MKHFGITMLWLAIVTSAQANEAHKLLIQMSDAERNSALSTYMLASGHQCEVTRNFYQGSAEQGDAFWNVECRSGKSYGIMIENDAQGSTGILECEVMKLVSQVSCFQKLE